MIARSHSAGGPPDPFAKLTPQEQKVLRLLGEGLSNREIADQVMLAEQTVKNYVSSLLHKLGLVRRSQAALLVTKSQERDPDQHPGNPLEG